MSTIKTIDVKVNGLHPNKKYRFNFANKGGNWPVRVSPVSGVFYPDSVKTYVYFCSTTGECPPSDPSVFFNTPASDISAPGLALDNKSLYSVLQLSISEFDCDDVVYTHPCIVECDECIPQLTVNANSVSLGASEGSEAVFSSSVNGLVPNQTYKYEFSGVGGNWPVKIVPRSGIIKTADTSYTINGLISVCESTGNCPSGHPNILNYTSMPNTADMLYSTVELSIEPVDTINSNFQSSTAATFAVQCDDCIHRLRVDTPASTIATISDSSITANLINTIPGRTYAYSVQPVNANWPVLVYPYSGTLLATSDTASLSLNVKFCPSTGLCPSGTNGLLPYSLNNVVSKQARFKLKIEDSCADAATVCSNNIGTTPQTYSNDIAVVCADCIVSPVARALSSLNLTNSFKQDFITVFDNLMPGSTYNYVFKGLEANWPAIIFPMSGSITPLSDSATISSTVSFCAATGLCPNNSTNVLPYTVNTSQTDSDTQSLYTKFRLELTNTSYDLPKTYSDEIIATCQDCINIPKVVLPTSATLTDSKSCVFNSMLYNLIPGESYKFTYKSINSNWPAVVYPVSGIVTAVDQTFTIPTKLTFCASTGSCANGTNGVLAYAIDPSCSLSDQFFKNVALRLELEPTNSNYSKVYSNQLFINCDNCLDNLSVEIPAYMTINSYDFYDFNPIINNMTVGRSYKYEFKSVDANWPAIIYPVSGIITATSAATTLNARITFCPSTGVCPTGSVTVLPYNVNANCISHLGGVDKNVKIKLELTDTLCSDIKASSNEFILSCDNCLQTLSVINSGTKYTITSSDDAVYTLQSTISNLIPGESYKYNVNYVDSNWPTVISRQSGEFKAIASNKLLYTDIGFCHPSGSCEGDDDAILTYKNNTMYNKSNKKFITINLSVDAADCSVSRVYSDDFTLECDRCLPTNFSVQLSGSPSLTLNNQCCSGTRIMTANAFDVIPGDTYNYYLTSTSNKITFSPSSGTVSFAYNGSGSLLYTMDSVMTSGDQSIIGIKLVNNTNSVEATDYMIIRCNNNSCI